MKYKVEIDLPVYEEIKSAVAFVNRVSKVAAKELHKKIIEALRSLEEFPLRYPLDPEITIKDTYRRMVIEGRYVAYYYIENNVVYVEYFKDVRRK